MSLCQISQRDKRHALYPCTSFLDFQVWDRDEDKYLTLRTAVSFSNMQYTTHVDINAHARRYSQRCFAKKRPMTVHMINAKATVKNTYITCQTDQKGQSSYYVEHAWMLSCLERFPFPSDIQSEPQKSRRPLIYSCVQNMSFLFLSKMSTRGTRKIGRPYWQ